MYRSFDTHRPVLCHFTTENQAIMAYKLGKVKCSVVRLISIRFNTNKPIEYMGSIILIEAKSPYHILTRLTNKFSKEHLLGLEIGQYTPLQVKVMECNLPVPGTIQDVEGIDFHHATKSPRIKK